jgi:Ferritin-like domain
MTSSKQGESIHVTTEERPGRSRRSFLRNVSLAGVGVVGLGALLNQIPARANDIQANSADGAHDNACHADGEEARKSDTAILIAAEIAEALAVTTYTNIINLSPVFSRIPDDDQGYLEAARQEEMSHYLLEQSVTGEPSPFTTFFYPHDMFSDPQTTLNTLVTLEDAFIAAYLVGVRNFSTRDLRVIAARIMGIESDHRTLARVIGGDVSPLDHGPIASITGIQGCSESIAPPNNNGYERTLGWTKIEQAVAALTLFVDMTAAKTAGFDITKPFVFDPFTPTLPSELGAFTPIAGCPA